MEEDPPSPNLLQFGDPFLLLAAQGAYPQFASRIRRWKTAGFIFCMTDHCHAGSAQPFRHPRDMQSFIPDYYHWEYVFRWHDTTHQWTLLPPGTDPLTSSAPCKQVHLHVTSNAPREAKRVCTLTLFAFSFDGHHWHAGLTPPR